MSLKEIQAAAAALPLEEKKELLEFLAARVNGTSAARTSTNLQEFADTMKLSEDPLAWQQRVRGEWP